MKKVTRLLHNFSLLLFFGLFLLGGCAKKREPSPQATSTGLIVPSIHVRAEKNSTQDDAQPIAPPSQNIPTYTPQELFQQFEARSDDSYFPLGFDVKKFTQHDRYFYIEGFVERLLGDVIRECQQEMERSGWYMHVSATADPALLIFNKPNRVCVYRMTQERSSWMSLRRAVALHVWVYTTQ